MVRGGNNMTRQEYVEALNKEVDTGNYPTEYKWAMRTIISWTPEDGTFTEEALQQAIEMIRKGPGR